MFTSKFQNPKSKMGVKMKIKIESVRISNWKNLVLDHGKLNSRIQIHKTIFYFWKSFSHLKNSNFTMKVETMLVQSSKAGRNLGFLTQSYWIISTINQKWMNVWRVHQWARDRQETKKDLIKMKKQWLNLFCYLITSNMKVHCCHTWIRIRPIGY